MVGRGALSKVFGLYVVDLPAGKVVKLREFERGGHPDTIHWSPDGSKLATDLHRNQTDVFILEGLDLPPRVQSGS